MDISLDRYSFFMVSLRSSGPFVLKYGSPTLYFTIWSANMNIIGVVYVKLNTNEYDFPLGLECINQYRDDITTPM